MAVRFREKEISEYRECFLLHSGPPAVIKNATRLGNVMRSLGWSPTMFELKDYLRKKGGKITFPQFMEILSEHRQNENGTKDLLDWFKSLDPNNKGLIPEKELKLKLRKYGEKLRASEVEDFFKDAEIRPTKGMIAYYDIIDYFRTPVPDY